MPPGPKKNNESTTIRRFCRIMDLVKKGQTVEAYSDFRELSLNWKASRQALDQNTNRAALLFNSQNLSWPEAKVIRRLKRETKEGPERIDLLIEFALNGPNSRAACRLLRKLLTLDEK